MTVEKFNKRKFEEDSEEEDRRFENIEEVGNNSSNMAEPMRGRTARDGGQSGSEMSNEDARNVKVGTKFNGKNNGKSDLNVVERRTKNIVRRQEKRLIEL